MRITVSVESVNVRNGVGVRSAPLGLAGGGPTMDAAVAGLRESISAWCGGLRRAGELEEALDRCGLAWSDEGTGLEVDIIPAMGAPVPAGSGRA